MVHIKETLLIYKYVNNAPVFGTKFLFPFSINVIPEIVGKAKMVCILGHLDKLSQRNNLRQITRGRMMNYEVAVM